MIHVERQTDARFANAVLNDPDVRPFVADMAEGPIDVSAVIANPRNFALFGDHGGAIMICIVPGVYEVHTQVLPRGRGEWTIEMLHAVKHFMFTRTDCFEGITRVPHGHAAAKAAALGAGMRYDFTRPACHWNGNVVPFDLYSITIQDWVRKAPMIEEIGRHFHEFMQAEATKVGLGAVHPDDPNHNRYVGAALEMARGGQIVKAVGFYNRWAGVSRHPGVVLESVDPPRVRFDIGVLTLVDGEIHMDIMAQAGKAA